MKRHDKALDTKPLAANNKGVALAVQGKHPLVDAASDGGSSASHGKLILPSLDAYWVMFMRADHEFSQNHPNSGTSTQGRSIGCVHDKSAPTGVGIHLSIGI